MEEQHFDDLARLIAQKTSRRQVLKVLAGAALGGMFANRLSPALAAGAGGCAKYCNQVFGEDTVATTQCIQDAKRGTGLCYTCGPASTTGGVASSAICCTRNSSNYCTSYSGSGSATCCSSGQTCTNGTCVTAGCLPLQATCTAGIDTCCDTGQGKTTCTDSIVTNVGPAPVCCNMVGGTCTTFSDCCGYLECTGGYCVCTPNYQSCLYDAECCSGKCDNQFGFGYGYCVPA